MFTDAFERHADRIALRQDDGRVIAYGELLAAARELGRQCGGQRQLLAIFCRNRIESVIGYVAAILHRHPALLLEGDPASPANAALIRHFQVSRTWSCDAQDQRYALADTGCTAPPLHDDLALLLSTSGSTGSKKLVRLSAENLAANATSIAGYLNIDADERPITTLPMNYSYGLSVLNSHLLNGAEILLTEQSVATKEFWNFARDGRATSFAGVPFTYQMLQRLRIEKMELPALRYFTQAGGKLDAKLVQHFAQIAAQSNRRFFVMYGQTEATARISYLPSDAVTTHPSSIGVAVPGGELSLVTDEGGVIDAPNVNGELLYKGPNVMLGYAVAAADLVHGDELHGVLPTGDIAYRNEQGFYFIVGRKKRFIKITGNRIGLDDIESFLSEHGYRTAATGQDEKLQVLVEGAHGEAISQLLWQTLSIHPRNSAVAACDQLPKSSAGKTLYPEVDKFFSGTVENAQ